MKHIHTVLLIGSPSTSATFETLFELMQPLDAEILLFPTWTDFLPACTDMERATVIVSASINPLNEAIFKNLPKLTTIISPFIGVEGFDLDAAAARNIVVANGQTTENVNSMAEATILLILEGLYDLERTRTLMRDRWRAPRHARMLAGRRVGLIGFGHIGRAVAQRLSTWGVDLIVHTRHPEEVLPSGVNWCDLDTLLKTSDIVSIHASLTPSTRGLLGAERLHLMKHDALLIATSRGGIVDETAVLELARKRPEFRLALDVYATEPLPLDDPLRNHSGAILTPHMVGHTKDSANALLETAIDSVRRVINGLLPLHVKSR